MSKFKWETYRVTIRNLEIINCWGEEYIRKLPKTMTVDLSRKGICALGTEVTLDTNGENEGFGFIFSFGLAMFVFGLVTINFIIPQLDIPA